MFSKLFRASLMLSLATLSVLSYSMEEGCGDVDQEAVAAELAIDVDQRQHGKKVKSLLELCVSYLANQVVLNDDSSSKFNLALLNEDTRQLLLRAIEENNPQGLWLYAVCILSSNPAEFQETAISAHATVSKINDGTTLKITALRNSEDVRELHSAQRIKHFCISPDSSLVVVVTVEGIQVFDTRSLKPLSTVDPNNIDIAAIKGIKVSPSNDYIAISTDDKIQLWDSKTGLRKSDFDCSGLTDKIEFVISPDSKLIVAIGLYLEAAEDESPLLAFNTDSEDVQVIDYSSLLESTVTKLAMSPDSCLLAFACENGSIALYHVENKQYKHVLPGFNYGNRLCSNVVRALFLTKTSLLAIEVYTNKLSCWQTESGNLVAEVDLAIDPKNGIMDCNHKYMLLKQDWGPDSAFQLYTIVDVIDHTTLDEMIQIVLKQKKEWQSRQKLQNNLKRKQNQSIRHHQELKKELDEINADLAELRENDAAGDKCILF